MDAATIASIKRLKRLATTRAPTPEPFPFLSRGEAHARTIRGRRWGKTSRFRGVYQLPSGRFEAKVRVAGVMHRAGTFDDETEAARAYDALAVSLLGDSAVPNFSLEATR